MLLESDEGDMFCVTIHADANQRLELAATTLYGINSDELLVSRFLIGNRLPIVNIGNGRKFWD